MTHPGDTAEARTGSFGADAATLPGLLAARARTRPDAPALLHKRRGIWQRWTWRAAAEETGRIAAAIVAHGVRPGDTVVVAGANRPRLMLAMLACQHAGAVPVLAPQAGAGVSLTAALTEHRPSLVFVAGEYEVHEIRAVRDSLDRKPLVVCDTARGLRSLWAPWLATIDSFAEGAGAAPPPPAAVRAAAIVYPARGDGPARTPSHAGLLAGAEAAARRFGLGESDIGFAGVPLAWEEALLLGPALSLSAGFPLAFGETDATMPRDLREAGPTYLFGPALLYRHLHRSAVRAAEEATWPWRGLLCRAFDDAGGLAKAVVRPARERLGLARVRVAVSFGEPLAPPESAFFRILGIEVRALDTDQDADRVVAPRPPARQTHAAVA